MRISSADRSAMLTGAVYRYAQSLFRTRVITGVRNVKERQIEDKKEELRQLIGILYRVLAVSSDSIMISLEMASALEEWVDVKMTSRLQLGESDSKHTYLRSKRQYLIGEAGKSILILTQKDCWKIDMNE